MSTGILSLSPKSSVPIMRLGPDVLHVQNSGPLNSVEDMNRVLWNQEAIGPGLYNMADIRPSELSRHQMQQLFRVQSPDLSQSRWISTQTGHKNSSSPSQQQMTDTQMASLSPGTTLNTSISLSYCLDRGNGQFTRLIPADLLPQLMDIPAREMQREGMVILPPLGNNFESMSKPVRLKEHHAERAGSISPNSSKRNKIYCDKWVHEGVCAFTQQGCKFKHEMPVDETIQRSLGLFQGFPSWWRKKNEDMASGKSGLVSTSSSESSVASFDIYQAGFIDNRSSGPPRAQLPNSTIRDGQSVFGTASPWIRNGIVPFVKGPRTLSHQRGATTGSWDVSNPTYHPLATTHAVSPALFGSVNR